MGQIMGKHGCRAVLIAVSALFLMASTCSREPPLKAPEGTVIARVGNAVLTLEELTARIPGEYSHMITREQNILYVRQWMNTELLYREALRLGVDREPEIQARLAKMNKDLLSAEIVNRGAIGSTEVSEQAVREYYENNREQFIRSTDVVRYDDIVLEDLTLAWEIRRTVTHETFRSVAMTHSTVPPINSHDASTPYVPVDAIPPIIRNAITTVAVPSITGPYRAEDGFHILRVLGKFQRGTIASLDEVRHEIIMRLSSAAQREAMERFIADIRSKEDIEFNVDMIPGIVEIPVGVMEATMD